MTLKLAMSVTLDPAGVRQGAAVANSELAQMAKRAQATETSFQNLVNAQMGIGRANNANRGADIQAYGRKLDELRAKYNPVFAAQRQYEAEQQDIVRANRLGAISQDEMTAALHRAKMAFAAQATASQIGGAAAARSTKLASHEMTNLSYQMNDMAMMLSTGQSPFMMMMQQGPQVTQIMGKRGLGEVLPALLGGITSLITPTTLFLAGITAGGYAAYAAFNAIRGEVKSTEDVLDAHEASVRRLKDAYKVASDGAKAYGSDAISTLEYVNQRQVEQLRKQLQGELSGVAAKNAQNTLDPGAAALLTGLAGGTFSVQTDAGSAPYVDIIRRMGEEAKKAQPNVAGLRKDITDIAMSPSASEDVKEFGDTILEQLEPIQKMADALLQSSDATKGMVDALKKLSEGDRASLDARAQALADYYAAVKKAGDNLQEKQIFKREYEARVRRIEFQEDPRSQLQPEQRPLDFDLDTTGAQAYLRAQREKIEALKSEISLIGASADARERAKTLLEAENTVRAFGTQITEEQANAIRAEAEALAANTSALAQNSAAYEILKSFRDETAQLELEIKLIGASARERSRALAIMDLEIDLRDKNIDASGRQAEAMRSEALRVADLTTQLERQKDAYGSAEDAGRSMIDTITGKLTSGDIEGAIEGVAQSFLSTINELAISNPIKNALYGDNKGTLSDLGGIGGLFNTLLGRGRPEDGSVTGSIASSLTGSMNVSAATVIVNGAVSFGGVGGNAGQDAITRLLNPANSNSSGNSFLDLIGMAEGTDKGRGYNETLGYGAFTGGSKNLTSMTLNQINDLQKQMLAHPANNFNSSALGRYQIVRKTMLGLRDEMGLSGNEMFDPKMQDAMAMRLMDRRGSSVSGLRNEWEGLRNIDADKIKSVFESTQKGLSGLGTVATQTGDQVYGLGGSFSNLSKAISQFPAAPQSQGGGVGGLFKSLFGGGASNFSPQILAAAGTGLFDTGGHTGSGSDDEIAGFAHRNEFVFSAPATRSLGVGFLQNLHERAKRGTSTSAMPGYQSGGFVGDNAPNAANGNEAGFSGVTINNNGTAQTATTREESDGRGGRRLVLQLEDAVGDALARPGSSARRTMGQAYGLKPRVTRR